MKPWRDLKNLPRELWILCFAKLVNRMGTMALPFLVLYLTKSLGFSATRASLTLAVYGTVAFLVGPFAGRLSDGWGAYRTMLASLLSSGAVLLFFPLARSFAAVLAMTALFAATNEAFRPASLALTGELGPPEQRKSAFALSRLAVNVGMSIGPAVGGFLALHSFPMIFIVDGLTTLMAAAILAFSSFSTAVKMRHDGGDKTKQPATAVAVDKNRRWIWEAVFTDAKLRAFLFGSLLIGLVFMQHQSAMPLFLVRDLGFSESFYGLLFTINTGLIILLEIPLNLAIAHWSHRLALAFGALLFALGFGALALARTATDVAFTVVIWTFGEMILFPAMSNYVSEIAPEKRHGEYMGFYMMAFSLAFMAGPWLGTVALERYGAAVLWGVTFLVGVAATGVFGTVPISPRVETIPTTAASAQGCPSSSP